MFLISLLLLFKLFQSESKTFSSNCTFGFQYLTLFFLVSIDESRFDRILFQFSESRFSFNNKNVSIFLILGRFLQDVLFCFFFQLLQRFPEYSGDKTIHHNCTEHNYNDDCCFENKPFVFGVFVSADELGTCEQGEWSCATGQPTHENYEQLVFVQFEFLFVDETGNKPKHVDIDESSDNKYDHDHETE